ncbi:unnamed protein product [Kuraishia capsulata CBS 1993]|uniref:Uncharacterized protein n=1 Tax=Kuraishia capsulata CBS 1993 TaxID=1382522 RepID=W6MJ38_9ASCO|nr:uncharacterized protein KUCA_T00001944001 [Kuraishia capsulata CBS 1993]CDK25973.1 unnamed protein product [Kuraishia capsulata CBS 1993]
MPVAIMTGANSGIGFSISKELARNGYKVYATDIKLDKVEELSQTDEFKDKIVPYLCDVAQLESVLKLKEKIVADEGKLDLLYNNAGIACSTSAIDASDEIFMKAFQINFFGAVRLTREFSRLLIASKGTICFTSSVTGIIPFPIGSMYCSSKAALTQYAATVHMELAPLGVKVMNFITGAIDTGIMDRSPLPEGSIFDTPEGNEAIRCRRSIVNDTNPTKPEDYAKQVVADILKGDIYGIHYYRGKGAKMLTAAYYSLPVWLRESYLLKKYKFDAFYSSFLKAEESA